MLQDNKQRVLNGIRDRKQRLERLEALLLESDEQDLALLSGLLAAPTTGSDHPSTPVQSKEPTAPARRNRRGPKPTITNVVRKAVDELKTGISVQSVLEFMERSGVRSKSSRPTATVGNVLRMLWEDEKILQQVERSSGRKPAIYEKIGYHKEEGEVEQKNSLPVVN